MRPRDRLDDYDSVSLEELDRRASLQHRVDQKYIVGPDRLVALLDELRDDHQVLEIDGNRTFEYRSVYFDTPSLKCFEDHIRDRKPRYKLRTRHYVTTDRCVFEVKVKRTDGETTKRSIDHAGEDEDRVTEVAERLLDETLGEVGEERPPDLRPVLATTFSRATIVLREGAERTTIDNGVRLNSGDAQALALKNDYVLIETKTEDGHGRCDDVLAKADIQPVSFSKYRLGIGRLVVRDLDRDYAEPLTGFFSYEPMQESEPAAHVFQLQRSAELGVGLSPPPRNALDQ